MLTRFQRVDRSTLASHPSPAPWTAAPRASAPRRRRRILWPGALLVVALGAGLEPLDPAFATFEVANAAGVAAFGALALAAVVTLVFAWERGVVSAAAESTSVAALGLAALSTAVTFDEELALVGDFRIVTVCLASLAAVHALRHHVVIAVASAVGVALVSGLTLASETADLESLGAAPWIAVPLAIVIADAHGKHHRPRGAVAIASVIAGAEIVFALGGGLEDAWASIRWSVICFALGVWVVSAKLDGMRRRERERAEELARRTSAERLRRMQDQRRLRGAEERHHDAAAAIFAVRSAAQLLGRDAAGSPELREALATAVDAEVARLQRLFDDQERDLREVWLSDVVRQVATLQQSAGLLLSTRVPRELTAYADETDVADILRTLLDNARKHGAGLTLVTGKRRGDRVVIEVLDHGPGIAEDDVKRIFERGRRGDTGADGSGLGLYRARELARSLGGDLWVEPRSTGARFCLQLVAVQPS